MFKITAILLLAVIPYITCAGLVGGITPMITTLDDPNVVFAVKAINNFYSQKGDNNLRTASKIVSASTQVVAGAMYRYTIEVTGGLSAEDCNVAVWSRPWLTGDEALMVSGDITCAPHIGA